MTIYNPWTGPTVTSALNSNPIGYTSDKMGSPLNKGLQETPISETVDTRGMYYASPTTTDLWDYRSDIGTLGNVRHTTSAAQYKDKIAQGLIPEHMKNIGAKPGFVENLIGGVGANILGFGHEIKGLSQDWSQVKDPQWWKATGEDLMANLYGSIKGKTGVSDQEMYDSMLKDLIYDKGIMSNVLDWGTITGDKKKKGMDLSTFRNIYEKSKLKKKQHFQNLIKADIEKKAAEAKAKADAAAKAKAISNFDPSGPTQASIRRDREDKSGRGHRGGFTNPGKGSYGPHKADGGLINFYRYGGFI